MIRLGNSDLKDLRIGNTQVKRVMLKGNQVWPSTVDPSVRPDNVLAINGNTYIYIYPSSQHTIKVWQDGWKSLDDVFIKIREGAYALSLNSEEYIYIAGNLSGPNSPIDSTQITFTGPSDVRGNLSALFNYNFDNNLIDNSYCYDYAAYGLFANNSQNISVFFLVCDLKGAPHCYEKMFYNCSQTQRFPEITTLDYYDNMCTEMFYKHTYVGAKDTELTIGETASNCTYNMFQEAYLHNATINLSKDVQQSAFANMFKDSKMRTLHFNTNGVNFFNYACDGMLDGCTRLTDIYIDIEPSQIQARYCFSAWALNVSDTGTIHLRSDIDLAELQAIDGLIPRYWNVVQDL